MTWTRLSARTGQELSEMGGVGDPGAGVLRVTRVESSRPVPGLRRVLQCLGAEAQQNRLDDRGVIEDGPRHRTRFHPGRHYDRRYPHAVAAEHRGVVIDCLGRRDVIIEAAVLVIDDDQERTLPDRACRQGVIDGQNEVLAVADVGGRVVIVRAEAERVEGGKGRVDPGHRRQRAARGVVEEACRLCVDPDLELGFPAQAGLAEVAELAVVSCGVAGVGQAQRRGIKPVPAPGNTVRVQVPDERRLNPCQDCLCWQGSFAGPMRSSYLPGTGRWLLPAAALILVQSGLAAGCSSRSASRPAWASAGPHGG